MNNNTDYYAILGVLPTAEDVLIRAAYKALAQRYHPDRYGGSPDDATRIMKNINKAYQVLSDPIKRKEYDNQRNTSKNNSYEPDEEEQYDEYAGVDPLDDQWKMAVDYYPDLVAIDKRLHNISSKLAYTFRAYILSEKKFEQRAKIATAMENSFLETYFGTNENIINFAKKIILDGNKEAARELNKAIKLFGKDADPDLVIGKIQKIYYPEYYVEKEEAEKRRREAIRKEAEAYRKKCEADRKKREAIERELEVDRKKRERNYQLFAYSIYLLMIICVIIIVINEYIK